jgi:hypothetical protein
MCKALVTAIACAGAVAVLTAQSATGQLQSMAPETFTAFAVNMANTAPRATATVVDIHIDRYSPEADRDRLINVFEQKGQDALLDALQQLPVVGYIRTPESLRYDLHFARQMPEPEGGRRIVIATDRRISAWEAMNRPRSIDYPFTVIELQLDRNNEGVGKASIATRIEKGKDGTIELENFSSVPVLLNDVKKVK